MTIEARTASWFCKGLVAAALAGTILAALIHDLDLLRGTESPTPAHPLMIYEQYRIGGSTFSGVDFAEIYLSANALRHGDSAYHPKDPAYADPQGRPRNYPPLMYWLYVPLSLVPFKAALYLHTIGYLLFFFGASGSLLWQTGLRRHLGWVWAAQAGLFFLTPIGATELERGQFDLLVAGMYTLCFACSVLDRRLFSLAAVVGVAGALKWTSAPFLGCFSALGFLLASGRRRWAFFSIPVVMLAGTLPFWRNLQEYWVGLRHFDVDAEPYGLTLRHVLPPVPTKAAPAIVTLLVAALAWFGARSPEARSKRLVEVGAPFALALACVSTCVPTLSYEYHSVSLLGLIPAVVVWIETASGVAIRVKAATAALFGVFLVIAHRIQNLLVNLLPSAIAAAYITFASLFLAVCVYILRARGPGVESAPRD
ncbi:MAG TPA: glycosyltransferase family 87 protein [Polyangia bacterium]|nr:glycosyltransferase family 87 protein [Polyangia bacterium]